MIQHATLDPQVFQQLKGKRDDTFGDISILAVGNLYQLLPVAQPHSYWHQGPSQMIILMMHYIPASSRNRRANEQNKLKLQQFNNLLQKETTRSSNRQETKVRQLG